MAKKTRKRNIAAAHTAARYEPIQGQNRLLIFLFWCLEIAFLFGSLASRIVIGTFRFLLGLIINVMSWPPLAKRLIGCKVAVFIFLIARSLYWRHSACPDRVDVMLAQLKSQLYPKRSGNTSHPPDAVIADD